MENILLAIIGILVLYMVFKDILHAKQVSDLENKLKAKDLGEYMTYTQDDGLLGNKVSEKDELVDLEDMPNPFMNKSLHV